MDAEIFVVQQLSDYRLSAAMKTQIQGFMWFIASAIICTCANAAYFGASIGYMVDSEDEIFSAQLGTAFSESAKVTHNIEAEIAYMNSSMDMHESINGMVVDAGADIDVSPIMVNYLFKTKPENSISFYGGVGIGYSFYDLAVWATDGSLSYSIDESGESLTWQVLAGVEFALSQNASIKLGYRYFYLDDLSISIDGEEFSDSVDDSVVEFGVVFNF